MKLLTFFVSLMLISILSVPAFADLNTADSEFLDSLADEGLTILFETPGSLNTGFFNGGEGALAVIATDEKNKINAYLDKINGFSLSETSDLREEFVKDANILLENIQEYGTYDPGCGSCITGMNEMYPKLQNQAVSFEKKLIEFYKN